MGTDSGFRLYGDRLPAAATATADGAPGSLGRDDPACSGRSVSWPKRRKAMSVRLSRTESPTTNAPIKCRAANRRAEHHAEMRSRVEAEVAADEVQKVMQKG